MSWDLSSEEVICNKLESQQTTIFAFSKKIKELEAKNIELESRLDILINHDIAGYKEGLNELEKELAYFKAIYNPLINGAALDTNRINELEKKLEIAVEALEGFILEDDHLPECEEKNFGLAYECKCMDRNYYNKDAVMIRAKQALTAIKQKG